jgi:cardiolipin synthase
MWFVANERKFWGRIAKTKNFVKGFQFITNSPNIGKRYLYQELIQAIRGAKNYIYLTTPYFVPDRRMRRVLRLAAKRGVEVKILVPKTSNYPLVDSGSHAYYDKLISSGIRIFQYYGELLHAKTAVIDDTWATIGSFNLDSLSFLYNFEANIVSTNALFAKEIREYFENDMTSSQEVSLSEWRKRSTTMKIKEFITLPIRRFL